MTGWKDRGGIGAGASMTDQAIGEWAKDGSGTAAPTWEAALVARLPRSRPIAILLVTAFCMLGWVAWMLAFGRPVTLWDAERGFLAPGFWFAILASFGVAYGLVSFFTRDSVLQPPLDLLPLARDLDAVALEAEWRAAVAASIGPSRTFALLGVAIAFLSMLGWLGPPALRATTPAQLSAVAVPVWYFLAWMASFWFLFRGLWLSGTQQRFYLRILRDPRVDLLDLTPFDACAKRAVDGAVSASVAATGVALVIVHPVVGPHPVAVLGLLAALGLAVNYFIAALLPARAAILRVKQAELARVRTLLRGHLDGAPIAGAPAFQDLLAWEARVESIPEWPINPAVAQRFAALLVSPLLGWAGSAAVNAGLDRMLG